MLQSKSNILMILMTISLGCPKLSVQFTLGFLIAFTPHQILATIWMDTYYYQTGYLTIHIFQVDLAFYPSVDEMSTKNFWRING